MIIIDDDGEMHDVVPISVIEDIKVEIMSLKGDNFPNSYYVKIIDKHIADDSKTVITTVA